jgi:hypothetical protein
MVYSRWISHHERQDLKSFMFKVAKAMLLTTESLSYWASAKGSLSNKLYAFVYASKAFPFYLALIKEFPSALNA